MCVSVCGGWGMGGGVGLWSRGSEVYGVWRRWWWLTGVGGWGCCRLVCGTENRH